MDGLMNLTKQKDSGYTCPIAAIVAVGINSLKHKSEHRFAFYSEPFFVPRFHQLVGWVQGASARWVCSCDQSVNLHSARLFPINSGMGGIITGVTS